MNLLYNFSEIKEAYKIYIMENLLNTYYFTESSVLHQTQAAALGDLSWTIINFQKTLCTNLLSCSEEFTKL